MKEIVLTLEAEDLKRKLNLKDGVTGPKGDKGDSIKGDKGDDGSPDSPSQIVTKLESLKGEARLDASAVKNLPELVERQLIPIGKRELAQQNDVLITSPTNNQLLRFNSSTNKWENSNPVDVAATWGGITGTLSNQTDLQNALNLKANSADLGTASAEDVGFFATAAQGTLADSALQSGDNISELVNDAGYLSSVTGDWTGTFDGQQGTYYLDRANHTGTQLASTISDFDAEVSNNTDVAANTAARHDAVTVTDSAEIDFTLTGQDITASLKASSIDESKLDASVNASLDLADSALQSSAIGVSVQAYDADLTTWAGLTPSANAQSLVTAANYAAMRGLLDLEAGTDFLSPAAIAAAYQPLDSDLTTIAGLTATTDNFIVSVASAWASRTPAQVRTTLGLVVGTDVQAHSANLDEYAAVDPSAFALTLLDDTNAATARTTLGLGTAATQNTGTSGANVPLLNAANTWSAVQTFASTGAPLTVNSTNSNANKITLQNNGVNVGAFGTGTNLPLVVSDETGTQRFFFTNTGRVAIGLNASNTPTSSIDIRHNDLQTTPVQAAGVALLNATNATAGVPVQISPAFRWYSTAWDTDNSVARQIEWYNYSVPVSDTVVSANLTWAASVAGGALNSRMVLTSSGNLGIGTTLPDKKLEVNLGTSDALRLTYNDANGGATTYMDATVSSVGLLTLTAAGSAPGFALAGGKLTPAATTTARASMNLPTGAAPTAPVDGDIWREDNTNTGLKIRVNGVTKTITLS